MIVKLYLEGGGHQNSALQRQCREAFSKFFHKAGLAGHMPRIIVCGARQQAFKDFRKALESNDSATVPILLVDSERPVALPDRPWEHIASECKRPGGASPEQLHLMVQAMEAWFHADVKELGRFYGAGFREDALSRRAVEEIPKAELFSGLKSATRECKKGAYSKGEHSFILLARVDPSRVRAASPWANRLLSCLENYVNTSRAGLG